MDYASFRKIIKYQDRIDSAKRRELLRIYLQTPTLPKLQAARTLLVEMKNSLNHCTDSKEQCLKAVRHLLFRKRSL